MHASRPSVPIHQRVALLLLPSRVLSGNAVTFETGLLPILQLLNSEMGTADRRGVLFENTRVQERDKITGLAALAQKRWPAEKKTTS